MVVQTKFSKLAVLILVIGLVAVVAIALISFSPILSSDGVVNTLAQAENVVEQYLAGVGEDFRIEEIMEFSNHFYVIVQEKHSGINAFELLVDRSTGRIVFEPGPNMMWNQKYGHMGGNRDPNASIRIDVYESSIYAQRWLDRYFPGASVEEANAFYGYYTMDVSRDGKIFGMLSVNGFTGEVWYHSWHGEFIRMEEH